jgi:hypothetical protein
MGSKQRGYLSFLEPYSRQLLGALLRELLTQQPMLGAKRQEKAKGQHRLIQGSSLL